MKRRVLLYHIMLRVPSAAITAAAAATRLSLTQARRLRVCTVANMQCVYKKGDLTTASAT